MVSKLSKIRSGLFIPDQDPDFLPIPDQGVKKAPEFGSGSATLNSYCLYFSWGRAECLCMLCGAGEWAPAAVPRVSHGVHDRALYSGLSGLQRGGHSVRLRNGTRTNMDLYNDKKIPWTYCQICFSTCKSIQLLNSGKISSIVYHFNKYLSMAGSFFFFILF